jgi:hypothetical protein
MGVPTLSQHAVWPVAGKLLVGGGGGGVQPVIGTSTVDTPSLNVPTQSAGTLPVVKVKAPPLLDVVTTTVSHVMLTDLAA